MAYESLLAKLKGQNAKVFGELSNNVGNDWSGVARNVKASAPGLTDEQAIQQKFDNAVKASAPPPTGATPPKSPKPEASPLTPATSGGPVIPIDPPIDPPMGISTSGREIIDSGEGLGLGSSGPPPPGGGAPLAGLQAQGDGEGTGYIPYGGGILRPGLGNRMVPNSDSPLAGLRKIY